MNTKPKEVRFQEEVVLFEYESSDNYLTTEEIEAVWFTRDELSRIFVRSRIILLGGSKHTMENGEEEDSYRGLEPIYPEIRAARNATIQALLVEQEKQRYVNKRIDDENLAEILRGHSIHRGRVAALRGAKDAVAAFGPSVKANPAPGGRQNSRRAQRRSHNARMA